MQKKSCFILFVFLTSILWLTKINAQNISPKHINASHKKYVSIPLAGNSWAASSQNDTSEVITSEGITRWKDPQTTIFAYFRTGVQGKIHLAIRARIKSGNFACKCRFNHETKKINITNQSFDTINIGTFNTRKSGYQKIIFSTVETGVKTFPEISDLLIYEDNPNTQLSFVKSDFYWGRRGPSVHLNYKVPESVGEVMWFYNETSVPRGNDVEGSYFMANGFGEGYFGIQVNSQVERRILFSVWSPFKTDRPEEIPADEKIILIKKGDKVNAGNFGDEGSGGQSYLIYPWKAGVNYRFLLKAVTTINNSTDFTAYFFAPEAGHWELIATFRRPKTSTGLKNLHSFLENFIPEKGNIQRIGIFSNQWVADQSGHWTELNVARFTADATARKKARLDYAGGTLNRRFYLKNCGFFNETTEINSWFTRPFTQRAPQINFSALP